MSDDVSGSVLCDSHSNEVVECHSGREHKVGHEVVVSLVFEDKWCDFEDTM